MLNAHKVAQKNYREENAEYRALDNEQQQNAQKNMTEEEKVKERQCDRKL